MSSSPVSVSEAKPKVATFAFVVAGLSFIPLIGVLFGLIAIGWGLGSRRRGGKTVALIGAGGIGCTILLFGWLFFSVFDQHGGRFDELRARLAQNNLNSAVQTVEFYRLSHGEYPDSLATLRSSLPNDSFAVISLIDPRIMSTRETDRYFYYERVGRDHYYLRGVAPDGKPFSPGALVPQIGTSSSAIGLLTEAPAAATGGDP